MSQKSAEDYLLQNPEISSTEELYRCPFRSKFSIRGRKSYKKHLNFIPAVSVLQQKYTMAEPQHLSQAHTYSTRLALVLVLFIFSLSVGALVLVYRSLPKFTEDEWQHIKIPFSIVDAQNLGIVLERYKTDHYFHVMAGVFVTYVFLQTFAIPGSLFLSILSGFLFPFSVALCLVCFCSALGASLCFLLSQLLGRKVITKYYPQRAQKWAQQVNNHRDHLFNYILFLRITPLLPNWFINLTAPIIGVPLLPFAFGTFFGVAPPSFIAIQGGQTLNSMTTQDFAFSWTTIVLLIIFGSLPLLPVIFKNQLKAKIN